jgi:hypothetical protein
MDNKPLDFNTGSTENNDINGYDEVIDLRELKPINDTKCEHEFVKEKGDEFEGFTPWTCRKCGRGTYLPDGVQIT